jgi:hypothetical protein
VLKLIPATLAFVLFGISRLASAQTATTWRDSSDELGQATVSTEAKGVNVEPRQREPEAPSVKPYRAWYGGQVLLSDALSLSLLATGIGLAYSGGSKSEEWTRGLLWVGALSYALVPATIHVLHERPGIAFASATLRVAVPGLGLIVGAMVECPITPDGGGGEKCQAGPGPVLGLAAGILWASLLDAGWFSYDRPTVKSRPAAQFGLAPYLSQDGKRAELRAFGTF